MTMIDQFKNTSAINLFCLGIAVGIFVASKSYLHPIAGICLILSLAVVAWIFSKDQIVKTMAMLLCFIVIGMVWSGYRSNDGDLIILEKYFDRRVVLTGWVCEDPDERDMYTNIKIKLESLEADNQRENFQTKILIRADKYPQFDYGDMLRLSGRLELPPEEGDFSYRDYLSRDGIYGWIRYVDEIESMDPKRGSSILATILSAKHAMENQINTLLHEPESSLLAGLLLGVRRGFSAEFSDALKKTGTTHIIAISGYNISIIVLLLQKLLARFMPRKKQLPFFTIGITVFTLLVGASASVVRAALMGWLVLAADHFGRLSRVTSSLLLASTMMLVLDPMTLWDLGFQLSFLATGGIIWVYPLFGQSDWFQKLTHNAPADPIVPLSLIQKIMILVRIYSCETLAVTLSAQVLVLPVLLYNFGEISIISPLANLLVLFPIPWVMLAGFLALVLGFVSSLLAMPMTFAAWIFLHYIVQVIRLGAMLPHTMLGLYDFDLGQLVLWYLLVGGGIVYIRARSNDQRESDVV